MAEVKITLDVGATDADVTGLEEAIAAAVAEFGYTATVEFEPADSPEVRKRQKLWAAISELDIPQDQLEQRGYETAADFATDLIHQLEVEGIAVTPKLAERILRLDLVWRLEDYGDTLGGQDRGGRGWSTVRTLD